MKTVNKLKEHVVNIAVYARKRPFMFACIFVIWHVIKFGSIAVAMFFFGCNDQSLMHDETSHDKKEQPCAYVASTPDATRLTATFTIDKRFSGEQIERTKFALEHWSLATAGRFKPKAMIGNIDEELQDDSIIASTRNDDVIQGYFQFNPKSVDTLNGLQMQRSIMLLVDRVKDIDRFETIVLHEIGHYLSLGHSLDPTDVMFPAAGRDCISYEDLNIFCTNWSSCKLNNVDATCVDDAIIENLDAGLDLLLQ